MPHLTTASSAATSIRLLPGVQLVVPEALVLSFFPSALHGICVVRLLVYMDNGRYLPLSDECVTLKLDPNLRQVSQDSLGFLEISIATKQPSASMTVQPGIWVGTYFPSRTEQGSDKMYVLPAADRHHPSMRCEFDFKAIFV